MTDVKINTLPPECCANCKFFRTGQDFMRMAGTTMVCARRAPTTRWPATRPDFWCGDFEAKVQVKP